MEEQQLEDIELDLFNDFDDGWFNTWWERLILTVLIVAGVCISPLIFLVYCGDKIATKLGWIHHDD